MGNETPEKYKCSGAGGINNAGVSVGNVTSMRSQEFVGGANGSDSGDNSTKRINNRRKGGESNEYHSSMISAPESKQQRKQKYGCESSENGAVNRTAASNKPLQINLKAMRRTSQASALKQSNMQFISSDRRHYDQEKEAETSVNTTQHAFINAAINDERSAQFCQDDISNAFRREDYILSGQSVIPQPMCESQLQSNMTHKDDLRIDKFITLASKSAAMGYEFSQNEGDTQKLGCDSNHSSRKSSNEINHQKQLDERIDYKHQGGVGSGLPITEQPDQVRLTLKQVQRGNHQYPAGTSKNKRKQRKNGQQARSNKDKKHQQQQQQQMLHFQGHMNQQMLPVNGVNIGPQSNYHHMLQSSAEHHHGQHCRPNALGANVGAAAQQQFKDQSSNASNNARVYGAGGGPISHSNNTSLTHGSSNNQNAAAAQNRLDLQRKRNTSYDQKFLFKKNFISKYQQPSSNPGGVGVIHHHHHHHHQIGSGPVSFMHNQNQHHAIKFSHQTSKQRATSNNNQNNHSTEQSFKLKPSSKPQSKVTAHHAEVAAEVASSYGDSSVNTPINNNKYSPAKSMPSSYRPTGVANSFQAQTQLVQAQALLQNNKNIILTAANSTSSTTKANNTTTMVTNTAAPSVVKKRHDLPQIVDQSNPAICGALNHKSNPQQPQVVSNKQQQHQIFQQMKSGSAQGDRCITTTNTNNANTTQSQLFNNNSSQQQQFAAGAKNKTMGKMSGKDDLEELTAVRHRIGNLLSSNNVLDETTGKELFKKDLSSQNANPQNNPFMLAADSGLAPPPSIYIRSRPSDDHMTGRADQSSETTVRSRNKIEVMHNNKHELKSATQKFSKKKGDEVVNNSFVEPASTAAAANQHPIHQNHPINTSLTQTTNNQQQQSQQSRKKSQQKLYTGGKMTDSTAIQPSSNNGEFVSMMPSPLDHRQSQQLAQSNTLAFGQTQHQSHQQQRTQSNPNNKVTAFIKIQHMPAEILLKEQNVKSSSQHHHNHNNHPLHLNANGNASAMRGHHFNAMMAQQRTSNEGQHQPVGSGTTAHHQYSHFAATANVKMSPYGNSSIKSWGRPVKSQYNSHNNNTQQNNSATMHHNHNSHNHSHTQHNNLGNTSGIPADQLLNAEKSLIVTDSSRQKKEQQLQQQQQQRQMSIARNVQQQMGAGGAGAGGCNTSATMSNGAGLTKTIPFMRQSTMQQRTAAVGGLAMGISSATAAEPNSPQTQKNLMVSGIGGVGSAGATAFGTNNCFMSAAAVVGSSGSGVQKQSQPAGGILEPSTGIMAGITSSVEPNKKQSIATQQTALDYQSYFNQITGTTSSQQRSSVINVTAAPTTTSQQYKQQLNIQQEELLQHYNPQPQQSSAFMLQAELSALDIELLANNNHTQMKQQPDKNTRGIYGQQPIAPIGVNLYSRTAANDNNVYQNHHQQNQQNQIGSASTGDFSQTSQQSQYGYGRQNSDQSAYMRNMRSVLHHNGLQQRNNFINNGAQQLSQKIAVQQTQQTSVNNGSQQPTPNGSSGHGGAKTMTQTAVMFNNAPNAATATAIMNAPGQPQSTSFYNGVVNSGSSL